MKRIFPCCLGAWLLVFLPISVYAANPIIHDAEYAIIDLQREYLEDWVQLRFKSVKSSSRYDGKFAVVQ